MAESYEPEYPWVLFGDGGFARFIDDRPIEEDIDGIRMHPLLIAPTPELVRSANITTDELTESVGGYSVMWVKYPEKQVDWLNHSPLGSVLLVWCSFRGENTVLTLKGQAMFEWDKIRDQREQQMKNQLAFVMEKMRIGTSQSLVVLQNAKIIEDTIAGPRGEPEEGDEG